MNTQIVTVDYRMSQWAQIIKERQNSGPTIKEFCVDRGIKEGAYFYWQRKLREAVCTELSSFEEPSNDIPGGWIELGLIEEGKEAIVVEVAGCCINVNAGNCKMNCPGL